MKTRKRTGRTSGEGLVVLIILLAIIGAGVWWLYSHKAAMDRDAHTFGREVIQRLAVNHDVPFLVENLSPQTRLNYPPSVVNDMQLKFNGLGVPQQPINIEEQVTFESQFFEPKGYFTAHLFYPTGPATMQIAISHPVGKWQVDDMTFMMEKR